MKLIKVGPGDYVNPDKIERIMNEFDLDANGDELQTKSWWIYTSEGSIKTADNFNIKLFSRKVR